MSSVPIYPNSTSTKLFETICLFEKPGKGTSYLIHMEPMMESIGMYLEILSLNSFPNEDIDHFHVFAFTAGNYICYSYAFINNDSLFSIVIVSSWRLPSLYFGFLTDSHKYFLEILDKSTPEWRFSLIHLSLCNWKFITRDVFHVEFITKSFDINTNSNIDSFTQFNPFQYFSKSFPYLLVWKGLLCGKRILVICEDPYKLSHAVFALASLTAPFPYMEDMLISLHPNDSRSKFCDNSTKLVGTTSALMVSTNTSYDYILIPSFSDTPNNEFYDDWSTRAGKLSQIVVHLSKMCFDDDPYREFLGYNIFSPNVTKFISARTKKSILNTIELQLFEKSKTFQEWFSNIRCRPEFRNAFLSIDPDTYYKRFEKSDLDTRKKICQEIQSHFINDKHMVSVIKHHINSIDQEIGIKMNVQ